MSAYITITGPIDILKETEMEIWHGFFILVPFCSLVELRFYSWEITKPPMRRKLNEKKCDAEMISGGCMGCAGE